MLRQFVEDYQPKYLTTYTRNPSVLKMISSVSSELHPLQNDSELHALASEMPHASLDDNSIAYHVDRYGEGGLFQGFDPADSSLRHGKQSLKEQFPGLLNIRSALVIAARINLELLK